MEDLHQLKIPEHIFISKLLLQPTNDFVDDLDPSFIINQLDLNLTRRNLISET